jgi:hypothetical protein
MIDLTEAATFDTPITVPEGTDTHDLAAENVQDIAQRLANRTAYLKARADNAAQLNEDNTFTAAPQRVDSADNGVALWESPGHAGGGIGPWKLVLDYKADASRWVRLFTGIDDVLGHLAITLNARWHISDSKWRPDNSAYDSFGLFVIDETMVIRRQPSGVFDWATWPANEGDILAGNAVTATTITAVANVNAFGDCNVAGNVVLAGEVVYPLGGATPGFKQRVSLIPLVSVMTASANSPLINSAGNVESANAGGFHWWPIELPRGAQLQKIEWIIYQFNAGAASSCDGQSRPAADYSTTTPPLPVFTSIAGGASGPAASGFRLITNDYTPPAYPGAPIIIDPNVEYRALWLPGTAGPGKDAVGQIRITFLDPGPRNN